jgi:CRP-like cAMP-binding protein
MTYLHTEAPHNGAFDRLSRQAYRIVRTRRGDAATSSLVRALSRYNTGDQYDAFDVIEAVTHVHEVESRHHFPTRSSAKTAHILVAGWGFRSQILWDGTRQIGDLLAPGDFCHTSSRERESWFSIEACGPARIAVLDLDLLPERARAAVELGQQIQQDDVIRRLRARLVSLGRRDARGRLAYLIAEIHARLAGLGLTKDSAFDWPFTQEHLADILGLTPVHTNRVLGRLRGEGLLAVRNREVTILDLVGLRHVGAFDGG